MDINKVLEYFKTHYNDMTVKEAAHYFGYSESHFYRVFKKETGVTPQDYLVSLKVQNSVEELLKTNASVLNIQLKSGYLSEGTFTNRIKKSMILSPKQLTTQYNKIYSDYKLHEDDELIEESCEEADLTVHLTCEEQFEGIIFIGLFKKPIPNQSPVIGKAILKFDKERDVYFHDVPPGVYYCLACVIHKTYNPLKIFVHKDNLRGRVEDKMTFPGKYKKSLNLRPPLPEDPPITLNLPLLFINILKEHKNEYRAD